MFKIVSYGMKGFFCLIRELFWRKRKIAFLIYLGLLINIICWGIFFWIFRIEHSLVILHYNVFLGIDSVADIELMRNYFRMYLAPIGGTFFWLFNLLLVLVLGSFSDFWRKQTLGQDRAHKVGSLKKNQCKGPDPGMLGIYIILSGDAVLQLAILLHSFAIFFVNK